MQKLNIDVEASTITQNAVTVKVTGWTDDSPPHAVCLFIEEVSRPNWLEKLFGRTWSSKLADTHAKAERIVRETMQNAPELERILSPYTITKQ